MPLRPTDRLIHPSRGTPEQALAWARRIGAKRLDQVEAFVREVYRLCGAVGLDAAILVAHSAVETGDARRGGGWLSPAWTERLNPSGIGITDGGDLGYRFASGVEAARAHVVHHYVYARGDVPPSSPLAPYVGLDPRYHAVPAAWRGSVRTIRDLTGKWWTQADGHEAVAARGNLLFPGIPDQEASMAIVFGRVPHPPFQNRDIPSGITNAWSDLGPRTIRAVCWHRMLGSLWGTDGYFRDTRPTGGANKALTDYGIGVAAQDGAANDGLILRWNDPRGRRSPWANGSLDDPYGDGLAFVTRYGVDAVNRDVVSIEISGFQQTPLSEASRNAIAALTAYWADQYKVSHETFPLIPGEGNRSFVVWHDEFTRGTGKQCPFEVVKAETNDLIERARDVLRRYQVGERPADPPSPLPEPTIYPEGLDEDLAERWFGTVQARDASGRLRTYSFNPAGRVSRLWLARGAATGQWPALVAVEEYQDAPDRVRRYFRFANGLVLWQASGEPVRVLRGD